MADVADTRASDDVMIIQEPKFTWALVAATATVAFLSTYLMRERGLLGQQASSDGIIFCTIIAFGSLLRAIPGMVELRLDARGLTARDLFVSYTTTWRDVVGPFAVVTTVIGDGISFMARNHATGRPLFCRTVLYNNYGLTPSELAETLNRHRRKFLMMDDLKGAG